MLIKGSRPSTTTMILTWLWLMPKEFYHEWWITVINLLWSIHHMASEISISTGPADGLASNRHHTIISSKIYWHSASIWVKVSEWLSLTPFLEIKHRYRCGFNPYKPRIYNQYIGIMIFPHIFKFWSTSIRDDTWHVLNMQQITPIGGTRNFI